MKYMRSLFRLSAITLLVSQAFFSIPAFAAGYQINETSPRLQGDALAGAAAASDDVTAQFMNPATLTSLSQNQVYIGASEIMPHVRVSDESATHTVNIPGLPISGISAPVLGTTSQNSVSKSAFVPDGYFGWRFNERLVGGVTLAAPFGLTTKYYDNSVLRFAAIYSSVKSIDIVPALAYKIDDQWSVGIGFQAQYMKAGFTNFDGGYTGDPAIDALIAATNPTNLKGSSWGYGYTLGALYNLNPCTRFGVGYRSGISEVLRGHGEQYTLPGGVVPAPSPDFLFNGETTVKAGIRTPAVLTMSAAQDIYNWTVKASAQLNFWNTFNHLSIYMPDAFATNTTIETKWENAWLGSLGVDYRYTPAWTFRGGVAYDETPTTSYRDPRIPDTDRVWLTVGASYNLNRHFSVDGAYEHIFMINQTVNVIQASGSSATSTLPLEVNQVYAKYRGSVDIVALGINYNF